MSVILKQRGMFPGILMFTPQGLSSKMHTIAETAQAALTSLQSTMSLTEIESDLEAN